MQIQPEGAAPHARERATRGVAFGLLLEVDAGIDIPGIADAPRVRDLEVPSAGAPVAPPPTPTPTPTPTRVRLDPKELERRWSSAAHAAQRVRELHDGEAALLTVELAPRAGYLLHAPGFGRILIAPDGAELICDPQAGSSEWSILLPAQALPLAATLRGFEVLHASGVVLRDRAALFAGPSGAGKSSLAAALLRRGAALLSDDTVALQLYDGALIAHPGAALLQLQGAEHERLSTREREALGPPTAFLGKQRYSPSVAASPAPFGALFLLERSADGAPIERIEAVDPFELLASTFNLSVRTPERLTRHLDLVAALAATGRIHRLRVQPGVDATQLAEIVHERLLEL
jgi:hypothetical protein